MRHFLLLACVASASAQMDMKALIANLSPQCQAASGGLMTSEFSTCSNLMGVVNILGAQGSLLAPWNAWVDSICTMPPCSASVLATATTTVRGGCEADAKKGVPAAIELSSLVSNYATIRNTLCLEYKPDHTRCASTFLATAEKASGRTLTLMEVTGFLTEGVASFAPLLAKVPKENICNDCGHALITALAPISSMPPMAANATMPSMHMNATAGAGMANMTSGAAAMCGPSFADGKIPDSVASPTSAPSGAPDNGAKSPANGGAPNAAHSLGIPGFTSLAILATATAFTLLF